MAVRAAVVVLVPLVCELENKAPDAGAQSQHGALRQQLLRELSRCLRLGLLVFRGDVGIEGICAILSKEHGLVSRLVKGLEEVAKADPAIRVDAPHVDFRQRIRRLIQLLYVTKNRRNRVAGVVPPDNSSHVPNLTNGVKKAAAHVQPVVVPLVANAPHENGRVVFHLVHSTRGDFRICPSPVVDAVHHPNASAPQSVQHGFVRDWLIGSHCVDPHALHQLGIFLHEGCEVQVRRVAPALGHRVPSHAFQVQRGAVHQQLSTQHLDPFVWRRCGRLWWNWWRGRWAGPVALGLVHRVFHAAPAQHVGGAQDGLVAALLGVLDGAVFVHLLRGHEALVAKALAVLVAAASVGLRQHQGGASLAGHAIHIGPVLVVGAAGLRFDDGAIRRLDGSPGPDPQAVGAACGAPGLVHILPQPAGGRWRVAIGHYNGGAVLLLEALLLALLQCLLLPQGIFVFDALGPMVQVAVQSFMLLPARARARAGAGAGAWPRFLQTNGLRLLGGRLDAFLARPNFADAALRVGHPLAGEVRHAHGLALLEVAGGGGGEVGRVLVAFVRAPARVSQLQKLQHRGVCQEAQAGVALRLQARLDVLGPHAAGGAVEVDALADVGAHAPLLTIVQSLLLALHKVAEGLILGMRPTAGDAAATLHREEARLRLQRRHRRVQRALQLQPGLARGGAPAAVAALCLHVGQQQRHYEPREDSHLFLRVER
mmetsp:Transcript_30709/g.73192  ORF Transcript_30709/g.73192 Transcript_30709/m.73192 type:complete len:710 (-) Transcript_30709:41-2170(-)